MTTAENGLQAVQIVSSHPRDHFDAIILDINMPIMDGYEASLLISQYFKDKEEELNSYEQTNCALIYALTADSSEETK